MNNSRVDLFRSEPAEYLFTYNIFYFFLHHHQLHEIFSSTLFSLSQLKKYLNGDPNVMLFCVFFFFQMV